jgi:hypothetical protein
MFKMDKYAGDYMKLLPLRYAAAIAALLLSNTMIALAAFATPPGVPDNYVFTPSGYFFDPACVHEVESGAKIRQDFSIEHTDGSIEPPPPPCTSPSFKSDGTRVDPIRRREP